jgi:hypothetical protein
VTQCDNCQAETEAPICWPCAKLLRRQLVELPWYLSRLAESAYGGAKLSRRGPKVSRGESLPGLPLNGLAADLLRETAGKLHGWHGGESIMPPAMVALMLAREPGALQARDDAAEMLRELVRLRGEAEAVVDLPPDSMFVGPCGSCGAGLYAEAGAAVVDCDGCRLRWDVEQLRGYATELAYSTTGTAADMWRIAKWLGRKVSRATFYRLVAQLDCSASVGNDGTSLYRWADVQAALDERDRVRAAKRRERDLLTEQQEAS